MSVVPVVGYQDSVDATRDSSSAVSVPRSLLNGDYSAMLALTGNVVDRRPNIYNAFPDLRLMGESLVGIYSSGEGHGNSDRQIMCRSDNYSSWVTRTFYENSSGAVDASLLDGLMGTGQLAFFKVWTVEKTLTGYTVTSQSVVDLGGGIEYAIWGQPIFKGGVWLRTGYGVGALGVTESVLLQSVDGKVWTLKAIMCSVAGRQFSEAALVECSDGSLLAIIREDGFSATRPLVEVRSTDGGTTWSAPVQFSPALVNGTQPFLMRLADNTLLLMTGDRVGASGLNSIGLSTSGQAITGISAWRSLDNLGTAWTARHMLAPMWSTDGGQPVGVQLDDGTVAALFYQAPGATNLANGVEPGVAMVRFYPDNMV